MTPLVRDRLWMGCLFSFMVGACVLFYHAGVEVGMDRECVVWRVE